MSKAREHLTENDFKEFLRKSVEETWEATEEPYLLSFVADDLKKQGQDYKSALQDGERLKGFVKRVAQTEDVFTIVQHPSQLAKVGLVPHDKTYVFPIEARDEGKTGVSPSKSRNEAILVSFFHLLKDLPADILDDVHIPTRAIVELLRKK